MPCGQAARRVSHPGSAPISRLSRGPHSAPDRDSRDVGRFREMCEGSRRRLAMTGRMVIGSESGANALSAVHGAPEAARGCFKAASCRCGGPCKCRRASLLILCSWRMSMNWHRSFEDGRRIHQKDPGPRRPQHNHDACALQAGSTGFLDSFAILIPWERIFRIARVQRRFHNPHAIDRIRQTICRIGKAEIPSRDLM